MNELYTANIALSVFAMAIMLFSLRGNISQSKIRNLLCGDLYATIAICALCEWSGVQMDGTPPALIPLHIAVKTIELSLAPLIGLFAGCVIHPCPRKVVHRLLCLAGFHALLVLLSAFTGLMFYVDGQNFYHHGSLYPLYTFAYMGSMVVLPRADLVRLPRLPVYRRHTADARDAVRAVRADGAVFPADSQNRLDYHQLRCADDVEILQRHGAANRWADAVGQPLGLRALSGAPACACRHPDV